MLGKVLIMAVLLLPDDCQPQKAEDFDTTNVQAVPVQTVLVVLLLKTGLQRPATQGRSATLWCHP